MYKYFINLLIVCGVVLSFERVAAQVFGGNPASLQWKQINTDSFRIIFPNGLDKPAYSVASLIQYQQRNITRTIGGKLRKINIVLQNQMTYSNGYVGLAPFRSEFYLMPPMDVTQLGAQNWANNLAIHEYRHVEQYNNFDVGLSHIFKIIFGENGQAFANALTVPNWFFEGDAVYNETLLSRQGRGRVPFFMNAFKSLYLDKKSYNYQKLRNGSYKNFVPNWYNLGYLLVDYGYQKYGTYFWKNVTHDAASFKGLFYPLQKGIKKYSGLSFPQFRDSAFRYYRQQWATESKDTLDYLTKTEKRNVLNYQYPYKDSGQGIIALRSDYRDVPEFVRLSGRKEEHIATSPISNDNYFSYNSEKIIYTKLTPDIRWGYRQSSDIELLDIATGKRTRITHHERYFTPDISHNGQVMAAVNIRPDQRSALDLLDRKGRIIWRISALEDHVFSYPKFSKDDKKLFVIERNKIGEMAIDEINAENKTKKIILPFGNRLLGFPVVQGDTLFFTCSNNDYDESWAYVSTDHKIYKVGRAQLGIYQSFMQNDSLIGSIFTANGYRLARIGKHLASIENIASDTLTRLYQATPKSDYSFVLADLDKDTFTISKYPKLYHPVNFHSLQPNVEDPNYSFTLYGENVLNTLQTNFSYTYNRIERYHQIGIGSVFGGTFIEPFVNGSYIFDRTSYDTKAERNVHFSDAGWQAGLQLPLNFSSARFYRYLTFATSFNQRYINWAENNLHLQNRSANYISNQLSFSNQCQQALQQIYPHYAQSFFLLMRNTIDNNAAWQFLANGHFYFPGIMRTHSFNIGFAWQRQDTLQHYSFSYSFPFSRGYDLFSFPQMWMYSLNYTLPVAYPDVGFADIAYFKRINANIFYDKSFGKTVDTKAQHFASCGAELSFDVNLWNQEAVSFTIRYSRLLNNDFNNRNRWEIILPVNIF